MGDSCAACGMPRNADAADGQGAQRTQSSEHGGELAARQDLHFLDGDDVPARQARRMRLE
jgi:hypothetical protein